MKVLALGGSGGMGRYAVQSLYKHSKIKKIYVADINADAAKDFSLSFNDKVEGIGLDVCLLYTSPSPRDMRRSRMPSSA